MKVLIVGAGSVGASIAKELMMNGHDVTIIDSSPKSRSAPICPACAGILVTPANCPYCARCTRTRRTWSLPQPVTIKANLMVSLLVRSEFVCRAPWRA